MSIRNIPNPPKLKLASNAPKTDGVPQAADNGKICAAKKADTPKGAERADANGPSAKKFDAGRRPTIGGAKNFSAKVRNPAAMQSERANNDSKKYREFAVAMLLAAACISFYFLSESAQTVLLKCSFMSEAALDIAIAAGFALKFSPFQFLRFKSFAAAGFFAYVSYSLGIPLISPVVLSILTGLLTFNSHKAVFSVLWLASIVGVILLFLKI